MGFLKKFLSNCACPKGTLGRVMLHGMTFGHRWIADWGLKHLAGVSAAAIVELGCGSGANAAKLLEKYPSSRLTGVDISAESVAHARKKLSAKIAAGWCELVQADVSALPLPDGKFDLATAFETVYFWPGPLESFREVYRVLAPGGLFMISNEAGAQKELPVDWTRWVEGMRYYDEETLTRLLEQVGFSIERVDRREKLGWLCVLARK